MFGRFAVIYKKPKLDLQEGLTEHLVHTFRKNRGLSVHCDLELSYEFINLY